MKTSVSNHPSNASPVELGVALTITHHEGVRRSLRTAFGLSSRALNLRIDAGMDLIFLCETTLPGSLPCLASLTHPAVRAVMLRQATLSWVPDTGQGIGRGTPTLGALERGNCFLTANSRKVPIATFGPANVQPTRVDMELLGQPNLLEFLRSEWFTLEISGTNRRRLSRSLAFRIDLQFEVQMGASTATA
ncbi:hypothetical protein [Hymenobacter rubripertinctus]|uniref:Uncharacterized protein n=1 Tax=Hymenobacter rubripertinctus TaxID=2029981 RepID=A0A418QTF2_9BACT|nr:hypothetical protein [Hymenobacter rubripertinctus]RIY08290.1 hypothetical protein D0T11_14715 [Hymenobacter rubripertinctus]